jgi:hypothetical protein
MQLRYDASVTAPELANVLSYTALDPKFRNIPANYPLNKLHMFSKPLLSNLVHSKLLRSS